MLEQLQLQPGKLANRDRVNETAPLQSLLPLAIPAARQALQTLRQEKQALLDQRFAKLTAKLNALKSRHLQQLEIDFSGSDQPEAIKQNRRDDRLSHIERVFNDHLDWLENTQTTEPEPFIQIAALFTGQST